MSDNWKSSPNRTAGFSVWGRKIGDHSRGCPYQYGDGISPTSLVRSDYKNPIFSYIAKSPSISEYILGAGYLAISPIELGICTYVKDDTRALSTDWTAVGRDIGASLNNTLSLMNPDDRVRLATALIIELAKSISNSKEDQLNLPFGENNGREKSSVPT